MSASDDIVRFITGTKAAEHAMMAPATPCEDVGVVSGRQLQLWL